jgi:spore maturation protein CgeB
VADDPKEFAKHVVRLLQDGKFRAEMARKARAAAEANYRWETQMAHLDQVIAGLVPARAVRVPVGCDSLAAGTAGHHRE